MKTAALSAVKYTAAAVDTVRPRHRGVTVLIYHRVGGRSGLQVDLGERLFEAQMELLAAGERAVTIDDALNVLVSSDPPAVDPVVVTFDDGTTDWIDTVMPILVRHRVPATFYVATDFVERQVPFPNDGVPISWAGLRDMVSTGLVTVGSHTHTHALLDRPPTDARLDLEKKQLVREQDGYLMNVYQSLAAVEDAARTGATKVPLAGVVSHPRLGAKELGDLDVSTVISSWQTSYSVAATESDRTYNLKVGAAKIDGTILRPGELFSFNAKTGDRTEKEGFRVAPVIQEGELIDGLAGGMCQVATTLHAASWFAGLEIVSSRPHSRPSSYITMGLDSTVVYPSTDLKLKNPFDFPIVIHYTVSQGKMRVELLGKKRVYDKVTFERNITQETPFEHTVRHDPKVPAGQKLIDQHGYPGYHLVRRRTLWKDGQVVGTQTWKLSYPATAEIVRMGSGPATLKKVPEPHHHVIPPVGGRAFSLALPDEKKVAKKDKAATPPKAAVTKNG